MIRRPPRSTRTTHSFPTRRSSDLARPQACRRPQQRLSAFLRLQHVGAPPFRIPSDLASTPRTCSALPTMRSEEHTSELQSLMRISYAVFCLKKKKKQPHNHTTLHDPQL